MYCKVCKRNLVLLPSFVHISEILFQSCCSEHSLPRFYGLSVNDYMQNAKINIFLHLSRTTGTPMYIMWYIPTQLSNPFLCWKDRRCDVTAHVNHILKHQYVDMPMLLIDASILYTIIGTAAISLFKYHDHRIHTSHTCAEMRVLLCFLLAVSVASRCR